MLMGKTSRDVHVTLEKMAKRLLDTADPGVPGPPLTKKKRRQLSAQEVQTARETAELFKSNIFKLQVDELIAEMKFKDLRVAQIEQVLHRLHECIGEIPETGELALEEAEKLFSPKRIVVPFPDPKPKALSKFAYAAPDDVALVGLFGLKTGVNQDRLTIDVALTMPRQLVGPKDYMNYRALHKRAFYVAYLGDQLILLTKKKRLPVKMSYVNHNDDVLCPVLQLESIKTDNAADLLFHKSVAIYIHVALPFGVFEPKALLPDRNCIKIQTEEALPPTPLYNSLVASMCCYDYYLQYLYGAKKTCDAFKDACVLGRLWLQQRGFGGGINSGGFGHFEFAVLLSALLTGGGQTGSRVLLAGFSLYQLFKGAVQYLATVDLAAGYLCFSSRVGEKNTAVYKADGFNTPTIFDKSTKINVLWKMLALLYELLRHQARATMVLLNDLVFDRFDAVLLQRTHAALAHDAVYELEVPGSFSALEKIVFLTFENYVKHKVYLVLRRGLGERVHTVSVATAMLAYPLTRRRAAHSSTFRIGLALNAEECDKALTKGPADGDPELAQFRAFWGARATLRRFKDGLVCYCVVWPTDRHPVVNGIVEAVLASHMPHCVLRAAPDFALRLPVPRLHRGVMQTGNFTVLKAAFEELAKAMYTLRLPITVKSLLPALPALRSTLLVQPVPFALGDVWNDAVLQFETSARWPRELLALEKTKTAFLLEIAAQLGAAGHKTHMSRDPVPFNPDVCLLNVLTPTGFGFRVRVVTEKDELLYLRAVENAGPLRASVQRVYLRFNQTYLGRVKHTRTVGVLAGHYPYYSPVVRLFKQWLDAHALLGHVGDELAELVAMKPFVDPAPYTAPALATKGLVQILAFLANWNWREDPLILDLAHAGADDADRLSVQAHQLIRLNFDKIRARDPSAAKTQFFVGTRDDPSGILWLSDLTLPMASRLTGLSRAAVALVKRGISADTERLLFTPDFGDFDFSVRLKMADGAAAAGVVRDEDYKNVVAVGFPDDVVARTDLLAVFVDELVRKFGNTALFSARRYPWVHNDGLHVVGGVFLPTVTGRKKFRATLGLDVRPEEEDVVLNKEDVFDQIAVLGGDLVKGIKNNR